MFCPTLKFGLFILLNLAVACLHIHCFKCCSVNCSLVLQINCCIPICYHFESFFVLLSFFPSQAFGQVCSSDGALLPLLLPDQSVVLQQFLSSAHLCQPLLAFIFFRSPTLLWEELKYTFRRVSSILVITVVTRPPSYAKESHRSPVTGHRPHWETS